MANQHTITSQIEEIRREIEGLKKRMDASETVQGAHTDILKDVAEKMNILINIGKWLLGVMTTVGGSVLIAYLVGHLPK